MSSCAVIGAGYVGLTTGVWLAERRYMVYIIEKQTDKVNELLSAKSPIDEPVIKKLLPRFIKSKKIIISEKISDHFDKCSMFFLCVNTPSNDDGSLNLDFVKSAVEEFAINLSTFNGQRSTFKILVIRSTVLPGTTEQQIIPWIEKVSGKKYGQDFGVVVNPEFLSEGTAYHQIHNPWRIVLGANDRKSLKYISRLYHGYKCPIIKVDFRTAEMIKYASNAFLALKISWANEVANLCSKVGIDAANVMSAVGLDPRIGKEFLRFGCGFGGSCLPKDTRALLRFAEKYNNTLQIMRSALEVNNRQPEKVIEILNTIFPNLENKKIAVLGLTFKGNTDDVRETCALPIVQSLIEKKAILFLYDPSGTEKFKMLLNQNNNKFNIPVKDIVIYCDTLKEALKEVDACIIQNDWTMFKSLRPDDMTGMRNKIIIDCRRVLKPKKFILRGFAYYSIGYPNFKIGV